MVSFSGLKAWLTNNNLESLKADTTVSTYNMIHIQLTHRRDAQRNTKYRNYHKSEQAQNQINNKTKIHPKLTLLFFTVFYAIILIYFLYVYLQHFLTSTINY